MIPFKEFPQSALRAIRFVLADIDDTITTDGLLPSISLQAMEELSRSGIHVIPVTGRPAGWCDHIARMWPVSAVVGENGAFYFSYDRTAKKMRRWYAIDTEQRKADRIRLENLAQEVLKRVPGSALASDQAYRVSDFAIDFREDVTPLSNRDINRIVAVFREGGATTKVSSIHVNSWFGDFDKLTTSRVCLQNLFHLDLPINNEAVVFIGDSPNDEPMFSYFTNSIGVANVRNFSLKNEPRLVTEGSNAAGFVEAASAIVAARESAG